MKTTNDVVQLTIPAKAEYIDLVRLAIYGFASPMGFSYEDIEDMKVAVAEACNNAVLHAYKDGGAGSVEVQLENQDGDICIRIKDYGTSFNYEETANRVTSLHDKELSEINAGGLGIYMMQALMDDVQVISESGTEVIMTKKFNRLEEIV